MSRPNYAKPQRQGFYKKIVTLTDAQIKALPTPSDWIVALSSPGAGKAIVLINSVWNFNIVEAYTDLSADWPTSAIYLAYDADFAFASASLRPSGLGASSFNVLPAWSKTTTDFVAGLETAPANIEDTPLTIVAFNTAGNFTGGNVANTLTVTVYYDIITL